MLIRSPAFSDGAGILRQYTCEGHDMSPPLEWSGLPPDTRSLVLLCDDPDAPAGTWHHWAMYDIPPAAGRSTEWCQEFQTRRQRFRSDWLWWSLPTARSRAAPLSFSTARVGSRSASVPQTAVLSGYRARSAQACACRGDACRNLPALIGRSTASRNARSHGRRDRSRDRRFASGEKWRRLHSGRPTASHSAAPALS
jgi:Phosphatidylethanolamine-binding protein